MSSIRLKTCKRLAAEIKGRAVQLEKEMKLIWPVGSAVYFFIAVNQIRPSTGIVLTHSGSEQAVVIQMNTEKAPAKRVHFTNMAGVER